MNKKTLNDLKNIEGKKVLIRVDFNVPIKDGQITSNKRILAAIPTIKDVLSKNAKVILFSHLGRIKTEDDKKTKTLLPIANELSKFLDKEVKFISETRGTKLEKAISEMKNQDVLMFENTRFEDVVDKKESKNNPELGKYWASLGDVFINDAFGTAHRSHASNVGIASNINESCVGLLVQKELEMLSRGLDNPKKPFIAIVGGAKVSDKISVISNLLNKADKILIGGGMAYTFFKSLNYEIGNSLLEEDKISLAKEYLDKSNGKIILPIDNAISERYENGTERKITDGIGIPSGFMGLDIGPKTIELYKNILEDANTVVWNGPMGVAEFSNFKLGTEEIAKVIAKNKDKVFSIIGGGDSAAAAINLGFENDFTHISTGGGASLAYMEGKELPGIEAIQNKG